MTHGPHRSRTGAIAGVVGALAVSTCGPPDYGVYDTSSAICDDGRKNGAETDIDCGGGDCRQCLNGDDCLVPSDCASGECSEGVCREPHCENLRQDEDEEGVDCGGADCRACAGADACSNRQQDDNESDVDCGGSSDCNRCEAGDRCESGSDCASGRCTEGVCEAASGGEAGASGAGGAGQLAAAGAGGTSGEGGAGAAAGGTGGASAAAGGRESGGSAGSHASSRAGAAGGPAGGPSAAGGAEAQGGMPGAAGAEVGGAGGTTTGSGGATDQGGAGAGGLGGAAGGSPGDNERYVSDLCELAGAENGLGPIEKDTSNGGPDAGDGRPITIEGTVYEHGLGTRAPADIGYALAGSCSTFSAMVGLDDEVNSSGSVIFEVWGDGTLLLRSDPMTGDDGATAVHVDVTDVQELHLVVDPDGDAFGDHGDWADATLVCVGEPIAACG